MPLQRFTDEFERLDDAELAAWRDIPPAIVSDCMNRTQVMAARIKPLKAGTRLVGQARTADCMVGDNGPAHALLKLVRPGEVVVIDAGAHPDVAIWGGILTRMAMARGVAGVVIDGGVRDIEEVRELGFPCYAAAQVPAGPHKGFGGVIDGTLSCGGCPVRPGDIVVGDDDGIAVVPLERRAALLEASRAKIKDEEATLAKIAEGAFTADLLGVPEPEDL